MPNVFRYARKPLLAASGFMLLSSALAAEKYDPELDTENIATEITATATTESQGYEAEKAVDGDVYTSWKSTELPASLELDLAKQFTLEKAVVHVPPQFATPRRVGMKVSVSTDGKTYKDLYDEEAAEFFTIHGNAVEVPLDGTKGRYIRITMSTNSEDPVATISTVRVYGGEAK